MNGLVSFYQPYHQLDLTCANPNTLSPWVAFGVRLRDMSDNVSTLVASMRSSIVTAIAQLSCAYNSSPVSIPLIARPAVCCLIVAPMTTLGRKERKTMAARCQKDEIQHPRGARHVQ